MENLYQLLYTLHGSLFHLFVKTWGYHWNVTGSNFPQYHELFGDQYSTIYGEIDTVAEAIRTFEIKALGTLEQIKAESIIEEADMTATAMKMISDLLGDNQKIINLMVEMNYVAEKLNQPQIVELVGGFLLTHHKMSWMLRSTLKQN